MKPILNITLLALVLTSAAFADNGLDSRIVNEDGSAYSGNIAISYNMDATVGVENQRGGVERTENGDTTLTGNISIIGGQDYENFTAEERRNHGVYLSEDMSSGTVTLKTGSAADAININVYGAAGTGLRNQSSGAKLVVDASGSEHAIEIHVRNTSEEATGGAAIYSTGVTEVTGGEINMSTAAKSATAVYALDGGQIDMRSETINISTMGDNGAHGVMVRDGDVSVNASIMNITTGGDMSSGLYNAQGSINVKADSLSITALNNSSGMGVRGVASSIEVDAGKTTINCAREGLIIYADAGAGTYLTVKGDLEINSGNSGVVSQGGGLITLADGDVVIRTEKNHGLAALSGDIVVSNGSTVIRAIGEGAHANNGRSIVISSTLDVMAGTMGVIAAAGGTVQLANVARMSSDAGIALNASGGTISSLGGSAYVYNMTGKIIAHNGGMVDLSMASGSFMTVTTRFENASGMASTGMINLTMQGDSLWTVTGNSQLTNLTLGQGSGLQLAFSGTSLTDIISATGTITLEAGSMIYLTGDLSGLQGASFDFFDGTLVNNGVKFISFDGADWVEYEYTQTGANTFAFSANAPITIEEPGFIPEPATATLGLIGLASLMLRRRRT